MQHSEQISGLPNHPWICAQIGSREHYSIPRALHQQGQLRLFLTDFWAENSRLVPWLPEQRRKKVAERSHSELSDAPILSLGDSRLFFDFRQKLLGKGSWETTLRRNEWFQDEMLTRLRGPDRRFLDQTEPGTFFSYSYAARKLFKFFRSEGWHTILGQIDPGPREEEIVARETERERGVSTTWERAPAIYWERWKEECDLADEIWVNSPWSAEALVGQGIREERIRTVPLVYSNTQDEKARETRSYPPRFTSARPMRVLFLGQINVRKGAHLLLEAARKLEGEPIEFWMVGPTDLSVPNSLQEDPRFRWPGSVSRSETVRFYQEADLFILPTLSDGFALTQLEAQSRHLPVLASRFCGAVVRDGENGLLLDPLNAETIAEKLRFCLEQPETLAVFSQNSHVGPGFQLPALRQFLKGVSQENLIGQVPSQAGAGRD